MRSLSTGVLFLLGLAAQSQALDPQADTLAGERSWAVGVELLRPVIDLVGNTPERHYLRLEGFLQHWVRPDIAWRASFVHYTDHEGQQEPNIYTDSAIVTRYSLYETSGYQVSGGIIIQKRQEAFVERTKHFAPLLGVMLVLGREDRSITDEDQAYASDSTGSKGPPIPGTDVVSVRHDKMLFTGFEVSPGLSGSLGKRWEVELRLPIAVTWWSTLESSTVNYPDVPSWWDQPVNVGVHLPRVYMHYLW